MGVPSWEQNVASFLNKERQITHYVFDQYANLFVLTQNNFTLANKELLQLTFFPS